MKKILLFLFVVVVSAGTAGTRISVEVNDDFVKVNSPPIFNSVVLYEFSGWMQSSGSLLYYIMV